MEAALFRYADHAALQPWQALAPDEELMAKEEPVEEPLRRAWMQEALLAFLFADGQPECWENVAVRALAIFRHCLLAEVVGRDMTEVEGLRARAKIAEQFRVDAFIALSQQEDWQEILEGIMGYLFPPGGRWLYKGCVRTYLVAKTYQPKLLVRADMAASERHGLSFEELARIFDKEAPRTAGQRSAARARWSARVKFLIRLPIEAAGGRSGLPFGKSAAACAKMAESAKGNRNRAGRRAGKEKVEQPEPGEKP